MSALQIVFTAPMVIFSVIAIALLLASCILLVAGIVFSELGVFFDVVKGAIVSASIAAIFATPCYFLGVFK